MIGNITKEQITALVNLQQNEIDTRNIKASLNDVDRRLKELDSRLIDFKQVIEEQRSVIDELNQKYRNYESDVRLNLDSIKKSEAKLSSVKTNKEYQSSLKEIEDLKKKNSNLEDDMIEFLDAIEQAEDSLKTEEAKYSEIQNQIETEREIILTETEEGKRQLENLDTQWKAISAGIDAALLKTYNTVKLTQNNAVAIIAVIEAVCQGCHMNIPPQMYNELQRGDHLTKCPMCQRLIYWQETSKRSE
jgi:predicted  nucleic acid-binding Zn-ribbon protein